MVMVTERLHTSYKFQTNWNKVSRVMTADIYISRNDSDKMRFHFKLFIVSSYFSSVFFCWKKKCRFGQVFTSLSSEYLILFTLTYYIIYICILYIYTYHGICLAVSWVTTIRLVADYSLAFQRNITKINMVPNHRFCFLCITMYYYVLLCISMC